MSRFSIWLKGTFHCGLHCGRENDVRNMNISAVRIEHIYVIYHLNDNDHFKVNFVYLR